MDTSSALLHKLLSRIRKWRYHNHPSVLAELELADLVGRCKELSINQGLRPLLVDSGNVFVRTVPGFYLWFDPRVSSGKLWGVEKSGLWETGGVRICLNRLKDGGSFLDIGANLGYYAMATAKSSARASVHAFEPVPEIFRGLALGVEASELSHRIVLNNVAVAEACGSMVMISSGQWSHAVGNKNETMARRVRVPTTTIDVYCREKEIADARVIKCDVEGLELKVLHGGCRVLREQRPSLVLEIERRWTERYGYECEEIFTFLQELGYSGRPVLSNGELGAKISKTAAKRVEHGLFLFEDE